MNSYYGDSFFYGGDGGSAAGGISAHASVPDGVSGMLPDDGVLLMDHHSRTVYHPDLRRDFNRSSGLGHFSGGGDDEYGGYCDYIGRYTNPNFVGELTTASSSYGPEYPCIRFPQSGLAPLQNRYNGGYDASHQHSSHQGNNGAIQMDAMGAMSCTASMVGRQDDELHRHDRPPFAPGGSDDGDPGIFRLELPGVPNVRCLHHHHHHHQVTEYAPQCKPETEVGYDVSSCPRSYGPGSTSAGSTYSHSESQSSEPETEVDSPESTASRDLRSDQAVSDAPIYPWMRRVHSGHGKTRSTFLRGYREGGVELIAAQPLRTSSGLLSWSEMV